MSTTDTFLAIFLANKTGPRMSAWNALSEEARHSKMQEGIAAWQAWVEKYQAAIVDMGGPLGKTKKSERARHRRRQQPDERLHGRSRGLA